MCSICLFLSWIEVDRFIWVLASGRAVGRPGAVSFFRCWNRNTVRVKMNTLNIIDNEIVEKRKKLKLTRCLSFFFTHRRAAIFLIRFSLTQGLNALRKKSELYINTTFEKLFSRPLFLKFSPWRGQF